jgi:hypothetical protein
MRIPAAVVDSDDAGLCPKERAELQRQGAKAAARGEGAASNPMHGHENMPPATGECPQEWSVRRDAWLSGFDAQATT